MADVAALPRSPHPAMLLEPNPPLVRKHWEGEFARFFSVPQVHSSTFDATIRPLSKSSLRQGTWLTASSPATIRIVKDTSHDFAVLSVSVSGYVHEEHIALSLLLSWPQIACVPQCPLRGSRVVFISYRDCSNQIQKFAVRFSSWEVAESFFRFFKDCLRDTIDIAASACDFTCDSSSNALQYKFDEGKSLEEACVQDGSCFPLLLPVNNINNTTFSSFPLSFPELLSSCSQNQKYEFDTEMDQVNQAPESAEIAPNQSLQNDSEELAFENDVKNEIAKYMSDGSFLDMLFKVEKLIHEHGDLLL